MCDRPAKRGAGCKEALSFRIKRRRFLGYHRAAPEEAAIIQKRTDPVDEIIVFRRTDMPFSKTEADAFQKQALPCDNILTFMHAAALPFPCSRHGRPRRRRHSPSINTKSTFPL
jgi:hypothetical protein